MSEDRTEKPYEINSTWWSAINLDQSEEKIAFQVQRYLASRSISLVLQGVPAMYVHGAIGTCNDHELVQKTGIKRDINRGMIDSRIIADTLKEPNSKSSLIREKASQLYLTRTRQRAFHPHGNQHVLMISPDVFTLLRISPEEDQHILTMTNVTCRECSIEIPLSELALEEARWQDLISEKEWVATNAKLSIALQPYDVVWLKPCSEME